MSTSSLHFAVARYPKARIGRSAKFLTLLLAAGIVVMVTAQLMTYEKFVPIVQNYAFASLALVKTFTTLLVLTEVLSLPFLLRMSVSPLFRIVSALALATSVGMWCFLGIWNLSQHAPTVGSGILGSIGGSLLSSDVTLPFALCYLLAATSATYFLRRDIDFSVARR